MCTYGYDACAQYTLIRKVAMVDKLGFVPLYPSVTLIVCVALSLNNNNNKTGAQKSTHAFLYALMNTHLHMYGYK